MSKSIYLDYAAATPVDPEVLTAMTPFFSEKFYNPSATYLNARAVKEDLEGARKLIASWLGAKSPEVYFTAGATEANNTVIQGLMNLHRGGEVLISVVEHESVLKPAQRFANSRVPVMPDGVIDLELLKKKLNAKTALVSIIMVNNELGTLQPLRDVATIINEERKRRQKHKGSMPLYFHTDAAQAGNYFDLHVQRLGVDFMTVNGGKIYGPKQSGVLFARAGISLDPLIIGGGQERGLRSGTENVSAAVGLAAAVDMAQKSRTKELERVKVLRNLFTAEIEKIPAVSINQSKRHQSPHILSVTFKGYDNERLMMELDEMGVQAAVGSACSAANVEPSRVLSAIGLSAQQARSTLRFSFGRQTTEEELLKVASLLRKLLSDKI